MFYDLNQEFLEYVFCGKLLLRMKFDYFEIIDYYVLKKFKLVICRGCVEREMYDQVLVYVNRDVRRE